MKTDYSDQKHGGAKGKPGGKKPPMVKGKPSHKGGKAKGGY